MADVPPGTIIAFGLNNADLNSLQQQGWWVCDGRTVTDPGALVLMNSPTPNLMSAPEQYRLGRFLVGAADLGAGQTGGQAVAPIPDLPVKVKTDGWDAAHSVDADPRLLIWDAQQWRHGSPITSSGHTAAGGARIATVPPYYTVIYLIKVK